MAIDKITWQNLYVMHDYITHDCDTQSNNTTLHSRVMSAITNRAGPLPRDQNAPLLQRSMIPSSRSKCTPPPAKYDPYSRWATPTPRDQNAPLLHKKWYPPTEKHPLQLKPPPSSVKSPSSKTLTVLVTLSTPHTFVPCATSFDVVLIYSTSTSVTLVFLSPVEIEKGQLPLQLILRQH